MHLVFDLTYVVTRGDFKLPCMGDGNSPSVTRSGREFRNSTCSVAGMERAPTKADGRGKGGDAPGGGEVDMPTAPSKPVARAVLDDIVAEFSQRIVTSVRAAVAETSSDTGTGTQPAVGALNPGATDFSPHPDGHILVGNSSSGSGQHRDTDGNRGDATPDPIARDLLGPLNLTPTSTRNYPPCRQQTDIKCIPFNRRNPATWFCLLEQRFNALSVTDDSERYWAVVKNLGNQTLEEFSDQMLSLPTGSCYESAKALMIKKFGETNDQKLERLFRGCELGKMLPPELLSKMKALATGQLSHELVQRLWWKRLPEHIAIGTDAFVSTGKEREASDQADRITLFRCSDPFGRDQPAQPKPNRGYFRPSAPHRRPRRRLLPSRPEL